MKNHRHLQVREKNPNWRGGRIISSHGYAMIRVGTAHPLADCRGYAYEHRLVMFEKMGRLLNANEQVHHIDENKLNNDPGNLELLTVENHRFQHRTSSHLKKPDEPNVMVCCACGCGKQFLKYDYENRPRRYISGHNISNNKIPKAHTT